MKRAPATLGADHAAICDAVYAARPSWVAGTISHPDARYLFGRVVGLRSGPVIEVGTASGVSTAVIATALDVAWRSDPDGPRRKLFTYDISPEFYADHSHRTGDAAREIVDGHVLAQISFRNGSAATLTADHGVDSVDFLFLDANHKHPMPAIDLLAAIDSLRPGAEVVLHDINLPQIAPAFADWGAKHVFDGLDLEKRADPDSELPNIGSVFVPDDKDDLRDGLLEIIYAHPWEIDVAPSYLAGMIAGGADVRPGQDQEPAQ